MYILGVRIDNLKKAEIIQKIYDFLDEPAFHQIATVNPEFILRAQKDAEFKNILNKSDLNVADGVGIWYAFLRHFGYLKNRIAGIDLMQEVLEIADKKGLSLFLAIHKNGLSSFADIKEALNKRYPNIEISGDDINPRKSKKMIAAVNHSLVFCNFGFPQQEKFINSLKNRRSANLQSRGFQGKIRLAMGVGGSFDFVTGKIKRAPKIMQQIGLEWLWRFIQEPRYRIKRIFNAVLVFPYKVIFSKQQNG